MSKSSYLTALRDVCEELQQTVCPSDANLGMPKAENTLGFRLGEFLERKNVILVRAGLEPLTTQLPATATASSHPTIRPKKGLNVDERRTIVRMALANDYVWDSDGLTMIDTHEMCIRDSASTIGA